jgi:membrane protein DedA with SNARE-associated domain
MLQINAILEHFPYLGIFVLFILGGLGFPFPEDTTLILCGFFISQDVIKLLPALVVVFSGLIITDFSLYSVGKKYGRMVITHKRFRKILSAERLSKIEDVFRKRGILVILVGRHFFGIRSQIFLTAGVMRMAPLKFIVADVFSSMFTVAIMVGAGYIGGNSLDIVKRDISRVKYLIILVSVIILAVYLLVRYLKSRYNK